MSKTGLPTSDALTERLSRELRHALFDSLMTEGAAGMCDATLTVERGAVTVAPAHMAQSHPGRPAARADARALYERCLAHFRAKHGNGDMRRDDLGMALACFVAANLHALHGLRVTPAMLSALRRQLVGWVQRSPAWASASLDERRFHFEQMAIVAVLMAEASALARVQGPAAVANVRRAARAYLQGLLGLNPDLLTLGAEGLTLRQEAAMVQPAA
jgi:hypothetical protein